MDTFNYIESLTSFCLEFLCMKDTQENRVKVIDVCTAYPDSYMVKAHSETIFGN